MSEGAPTVISEAEKKMYKSLFDDYANDEGCVSRTGAKAAMLLLGLDEKEVDARLMAMLKGQDTLENVESNELYHCTCAMGSNMLR